MGVMFTNLSNELGPHPVANGALKPEATSAGFDDQQVPGSDRKLTSP